MSRHRAAVIASAVLAMVAPACGISAEVEAERVPPTDVPFGLLSGPPTVPTSIAGQEVDVFLVADESMSGVSRFVDTGATPVEVLEALSSGPTEQERALGLSTALPPDQVSDVSISRGIARVDLRSSFADLGPRDQALAIAQLVYTLTGLPGIGRVAITLEGEAIEVPRGDGALTTDSLARDDFASVAPGSGVAG